MKDRTIRNSLRVGMLCSAASATAGFFVFTGLLSDSVQSQSYLLASVYAVLTVGNIRSWMLSLMDIWDKKLFDDNGKELMVVTGTGYRE